MKMTFFEHYYCYIHIYKKKKKPSHSWMCLMCFDSWMMLAKGLNQSSFAKLEI